MEWYPDLIYIVINVLAVLTLTFGVSFVILSNIINWKAPLYKLASMYLFRGILINIGVSIILKYFYGSSLFFQVGAGWVTIGMAALCMYCVKIWSTDGYLKIILGTLIADYTAMFFEGIIILIVSLLRGRIWYITNEVQPSAFWVFVGGILSVVFVRYAGNKLKLFQRYRNWEMSHCFLWGIFCTGNYLLGLYSTVYTQIQDASFLFQPYAIIISTLVMIVILYMLYQKLRQKRLYQENQRLQLQQNLLTEYYAALENQVDMTRKMRHDIANHMQTLEALAKQEKDNPLITSYADQLKRSYKSLERMNYCQNIVIDSVIYNKIKVCGEEKIKAVIDMNSFENRNLPEIEVLSVLYNLFDNAIEACLKIKDEEKRFLELRGGTAAGHLLLKMRNSANPEELRMENGRFLTRKRDKVRHGVGMDIIKDFVRRYDGTMEVTAEGDVFEVRISVRDEEKLREYTGGRKGKCSGILI